MATAVEVSARECITGCQGSSGCGESREGRKGRAEEEGGEGGEGGQGREVSAKHVEVAAHGPEGHVTVPGLPGPYERKRKSVRMGHMGRVLP